jgi:putative endonuclease
MNRRQQIGHAWEDIAGEYLERQGLAILKRRYRCRMGELDLVCRDGATLVIVGGRARSRAARAPALETVDRGKQQRIIQATRHLMLRNPGWNAFTMRFDVVAIDDIDGGHARFHWVQNAFECG